MQMGIVSWRHWNRERVFGLRVKRQEGGWFRVVGGQVELDIAGHRPGVQSQFQVGRWDRLEYGV